MRRSRGSARAVRGLGACGGAKWNRKESIFCARALLRAIHESNQSFMLVDRAATPGPSSYVLSNHEPEFVSVPPPKWRIWPRLPWACHPSRTELPLPVHPEGQRMVRPALGAEPWPEKRLPRRVQARSRGIGNAREARAMRGRGLRESRSLNLLVARIVWVVHVPELLLGRAADGAPGISRAHGPHKQRRVLELRKAAREGWRADTQMLGSEQAQ